MNLYFPSGQYLTVNGDSLTPENSPLMQISFSILKFDQGEKSILGEEGFETAIIVLSGKIFAAGSEIPEGVLGDRDSVFGGKACALYLPPGIKTQIVAKESTELAVSRTPSTEQNLKPKIITPADVETKSVGKDNWSRSVNVIMGPDFPADKMVIGETYNPPGNWSSSPPHKHERHDPPHESLHEELYYYRLNPSQGFGIQRIYTEDGTIDECHSVKDGDVIVIPRGYHPVVAGPGYELYYLWILAGTERQTAWREDQTHSWIHNKYK